MDAMILLLEVMKQDEKTARVVLKDGTIIVGKPMFRQEDTGPDEEEDGFLIETMVNENYVYEEVIESQIVSVEEVAA